MPGVHVGQRRRRAIEDAEEERREPVSLDRADRQPVQLADDGSGRLRTLSENCLKARLQRRREESSVHPLARHVAERDGETIS
jgi:hypothetical protein